MNYKKYLLSIAVSYAVAAQGFAASADDARQIGSTLTEFGATIAGNADGSIPAYDPAKALTKPPAGYSPRQAGGGFPYVDPYAADKPLFSITGSLRIAGAALGDDAGIAGAALLVRQGAPARR